MRLEETAEIVRALDVALKESQESFKNAIAKEDHEECTGELISALVKLRAVLAEVKARLEKDQNTESTNPDIISYIRDSFRKLLEIRPGE